MIKARLADVNGALVVFPVPARGVQIQHKLSTVDFSRKSRALPLRVCRYATTLRMARRHKDIVSSSKSGVLRRGSLKPGKVWKNSDACWLAMLQAATLTFPKYLH